MSDISACIVQTTIMKKLSLIFAMLLLGVVPSTAVFADYSCTYDLRFGVITGIGHVRVLDSSRTLFQINNGSQLFIGGKLKELTQSQAQLVKDYADSLEHVVPEITLLAKEGVGLVTNNITRVYSGLVGKDSNGADELKEKMKKVKNQVRERFGFNGEYYFINPDKLEINDALDTSIQAQIESGFSNVSGVLTALGTFDVAEESEDNYQLRKRARKTCKKLKAIEQTEKMLRTEIQALSKLSIVTEAERYER